MIASSVTLTVNSYTGPGSSGTLTCATNDRGVDLAQLKKSLAERGYAFDDGYGTLKGKTFRVAHMGDMELDDLKEITTEMEDILNN